MNSSDGLQRVNLRDFAEAGEAHPRLHVAGVRQLGPIMANPLQRCSADHDRGRTSAVPCASAAKAFQELLARQHSPVCGLPARIYLRDWVVIVADPKHPSKGEINFWMLLHDGCRSKETARRQKIIGAKSREVVRGGPIDTFIV